MLPPDEINDIIRLIGTVENRTLLISKTLGLDASFFKSTDPAGNLKEFNATYEGEISANDKALTDFVTLTHTPPDKHTQAMIDALPPGAFGVWDKAPLNGLFALFTMEAQTETPETDKERFKAVIGRPILVLERDGKSTLTDAGEILGLLSGTIPKQQSGVPSDEQKLSLRLKSLKNHIRQGFGVIGLPRTIVPRLVCWMELRK